MVHKFAPCQEVILEQVSFSTVVTAYLYKPCGFSFTDQKRKSKEGKSSRMIEELDPEVSCNCCSLETQWPPTSHTAMASPELRNVITSLLLGGNISLSSSHSTYWNPVISPEWITSCVSQTFHCYDQIHKKQIKGRLT